MDIQAFPGVISAMNREQVDAIPIGQESEREFPMAVATASNIELAVKLTGKPPLVSQSLAIS